MPVVTPQSASALRLFERFPRLGDAVPRVPIGHWPTPVMPANRFAAAIGLESLWIKREDLSHPDAGGNKVRGLEFLLGRARQRGVRTLVTFSSAGSHHICKTAWHARRLGMHTIAVMLHQQPAAYVRRNIATELACGATLLPTGYAGLAVQAIRALAMARAAGPWMLVGPGGTSPLSCIGHVNAAFELKRQIDAGQCPAPDAIFVAMGSLGTAAGLLLGLKLAGLSARLVGVAVSYRWYCTPARTARLARRTARLMRRLDPSVPDVAVSARDIDVTCEALGRGYARFTPGAMELARQFHATEGLHLDGTYTAKALDGALRWLKSRGADCKVPLLWHTYHELRECADGLNPPAGLRRYFEGPMQPLDEPPRTSGRDKGLAAPDSN